MIKQKLFELCTNYLNKYNNIVPEIENLLEIKIIEKGVLNYFNFNYDQIKLDTLSYVKSLNINHLEYKYSKNSNIPSLYSSVYTLLIYSLYDEIKDLSVHEIKKWGNYINSFQNEEDGLYYDSNIRNEYYDDSDWWGARHLNLHIINALMVLNIKPKYEFKFLTKYYDLQYTQKWLSSFNWDQKFSHENDIDNKLMNIVISLQFQRDCFNDNKAGSTVEFIQHFLYSKINPSTGMWGTYDIHNKEDLSRMVQFAYHLFPIFFYDDIIDFQYNKIIDFTLRTQNKYGGFGVKLNSSACEDIDSIDILIKFSKFTNYKSEEIKKALQRAFIFVLGNQNEDGGFVFRRDEKFWYGHYEMSSGVNESAIFPTWFRTLSIAYLSEYFKIGNYNIVKSPGY